MPFCLQSSFLNLTCIFEIIIIVVIAQSVWQQAVGWTTRFNSWQGQDFSVLHSVQTGSGAHPASYPMGSRFDFHRSKAARA
jgi:hypothetical protein